MKILLLIIFFLILTTHTVEAKGYVRHAHIKAFRITVHATGKLRHYRVLHVKRFKL